MNTRVGEHAALPLPFSVTGLAVSFTITVTLVAGFKDEEKNVLSRTEAFNNCSQCSTSPALSWKPRSESLAKAWCGPLTRAIEGVTAD